MKIYRLLSGLGFLPTYTLKILFVVIIGIHIPLIGIAIFLSTIFANDISISQIFILTFILTVVASALALYAINELLLPIKKAKESLENYLNHQQLPDLAATYHDEIGWLMTNVQLTITGLERQTRERNDMISLLSHDLRSPVSSVINLAELIMIENESVVVNDYCTRIIGHSESQLQQMNTVLQVLRETKDTDLPLEKSHIPLKDLLSRVTNSLEAELCKKHIELVPKFEETCDTWVHVETFLQVLTNILHNAIKFSFQNGQIIIVALQKNRQLFLSIKDQGIGLDNPLAMINIFDRFTYSKQLENGGGGASGIGLYLCKKIIQKHGGSIEASSNGKNKGTTIQIVLPAN